jgi:cell division protein FtsB
MSLGMGERQARIWRRTTWAVVKWAVALALIGLAGLFVYQTAMSVAEIDLHHKNEQIAQLTAQLQVLQTENAGLRARAAQAQQQMKEAEQRHKAEMPTGDSKALLDLANRKLGEGVDAARLTFLINAASNPRVCDDKPETRRVQVKTPIGKTGKEASAAFAGRKITVTAQGQPALDDKGQKESWFDPAQPITVHFAPLDGQAIDASGVVPLQHRMVVGGSEFRFSIDVDQHKGFAMVTGERCNFP